MNSPGTEPAVVRWGAFVLDTTTRTFQRDGAVVPLQPRTFDVLAALASRLDQAVSRQELLRVAWPGVKVVDNALTQVIRRVRAALGDEGPEPVWLLALSKHGYRLRGSPPVRSAVAPRTSADSYVGRAAELAELDQVGAGLVTVTGPGGVGKTRLLTEVAAHRPVCWVELAGITDPEVVPVVVASALGLADPKHLSFGLSRLEGALVLDDAERLGPALGERVRAWLVEVPALCVLVSSRVPLGVEGERVVRLEPLNDEEARRLLAARSGRPTGGDPGFGTLLERLDGLPLAIELFAVHARYLPANELVARLDGRLTGTGDGRGDRPPRHETLRACLEAGLELLDPSAFEAVVALGVFETTFDATGADRVGGPGCAWEVPRLCHHGLVRFDVARGRWRLPAAVREWVRSLVHPGRAEAWARHASFVSRPLAEREGATYTEVLTELLSAIERTRDTADAELATRLGRALYDLHSRVGALSVLADRLAELAPRAGPKRGELWMKEAAVRRLVAAVTDDRVERALEAARGVAEGSADDALLVEVLWLRGAWAIRRGDPSLALADLERARDLALAGRRPVAVILGHLSRAYGQLGRGPEAVGAARDALAFARESEPSREADALLQLATVVRIGGHHDDARALAESAIVAFRANGQRLRQAAALNVLGIVHLESGRPREAATALRDSVALHAEHGALADEAVARTNLANACRELGDLDEAELEYRRSVALARGSGDPRTEVFAALNLGSLLTQRGAVLEGREALARVKGVAAELGHRVVLRWAQVEHARTSLHLGEMAAAADELRGVGELSGFDGLLRNTRDLLLARALRPEAPDEARRLLAATERAIAEQGLSYPELLRELATARAELGTDT